MDVSMLFCSFTYSYIFQGLLGTDLINIQVYFAHVREKYQKCNMAIVFWFCIICIISKEEKRTILLCRKLYSVIFWLYQMDFSDYIAKKPVIVLEKWLSRGEQGQLIWQANVPF